jgi:hypothetical protein
MLLICVYCDETICRSRLFEWNEMYLSNRSNLHDEPKTAKMYINIKKVRNICANLLPFHDENNA